MPLSQHGLVRVAVGSPKVSVADPQANAAFILDLLAQSEKQDCALVVFPELCLTGYTCADLFHQRTLLDATRDGLLSICQASAKLFRGLAVIGLPLVVRNDLFNVAAVIYRGKILGLVPKSYLPTYQEFYERRWFTPGFAARPPSVNIDGDEVPFGTDLLFQAEDVPEFVFGVEVCEDLWVPVPPSSHLSLQGATVIANPSASTELIGKMAYRRTLVTSQSGRCVAAYLYAGSGVLESTTDVIFSGHSLIAENGVLLKESKRFEREGTLTVTEIDLDRLIADRIRQSTFGDVEQNEQSRSIRKIEFQLKPEGLKKNDRLQRSFDPHPFVPANPADRDERCDEIFKLQVAGLAKRLETVGKAPLSLGVSGGLDSTLALLVACKTLDVLKWPRQQLTGFIMPGFGSTATSRNQAEMLIGQLNVGQKVIDIRPLCMEEMRSLGHKPFGIDLTNSTLDQFSEALKKVPRDQRNDLIFENVQARMRTNLLMNAGFVIGTGDLSELALGWCTYNGDQISMYNPNISVPKTLVKFLVRWAADHEFSGPVRQVLHDIADRVMTPELLPMGATGTEVQSTEESVGPYELQDFYLYYFLRFGYSPEKLLFISSQTKFDRPYTEKERRHWLALFLKRFFANQFKRSCLPDGPKVGTITLSPRGDWRMPSDASVAAWLRTVENN
jgi:NAD+ synthase (glutamine-hydrolysing)